MAWISGRTISPESGELVFTIDENAQLPGPQNWEQLWQVCEGIPPIVTTSEELAELRFAECPSGAHVDDGTALTRALPGMLLREGEALLQRTDNVSPQDEDPMSRCQSYRRTLTWRYPNFEITKSDEVVTTEGCIDRNCDSIAIYLRIRGKNPSRDVLNATFPNDILRAICWNESRWRHFLPNGKPVFNSNSNGTTDWGLMQINQATYEQQWNWKSNLARGIALLDEKRRHAETYLNRHPQDVTLEMTENEMIQRYNGGAYHKWNEDEGKWEAQPPNNYVSMIRSYMDKKPW